MSTRNATTDDVFEDVPVLPSCVRHGDQAQSGPGVWWCLTCKESFPNKGYVDQPTEARSEHYWGQS